MARLRTLKPGYFANEELALIHPLGRILFAGLWCWADREGRLEDRPRRLKNEILGYDECDVDALLRDLDARGFIARYEVGGERYIQVIKFWRHQKPHRSEVESVIPPNPVASTEDDHGRPPRTTMVGNKVLPKTPGLPSSVLGNTSSGSGGAASRMEEAGATPATETDEAPDESAVPAQGTGEAPRGGSVGETAPSRPDPRAAGVMATIADLARTKRLAPFGRSRAPPSGFTTAPHPARPSRAQRLQELSEV